jgi:hypothetical protein
MKKIIATCLFIAEPFYNPYTGKQKQNGHKYIAGIFQNILARNQWFPDWEIVIFYDNTLPLLYIDLFRACHNVSCILYDNPMMYDITTSRHSGLSMTVSRYTAFDHPSLADADVILFRDADTHVSEYDAKEIKIWLNSDTTMVHRYLIDKSDDLFPLLGGAFGIRPKLLRENKISLTAQLDLFLEKKFPYTYGIDQYFLRECFWSKLTHLEGSVNTRILSQKQDIKENSWDFYFILPFGCLPKAKNFLSWIKTKFVKNAELIGSSDWARIVERRK